MFKLIEFFKKRPSDKAILFSRIIFWLIIVLLLAIFFNDYEINLPQSLEWNEIYVKYSLFILGLVPIIMWSTNICIAKRKYVRIIQLIFWIVLIIVWNNINMIESSQTMKIQTNTGSTSFEDATKNQKWPIVNVWFWIAFLSIMPLIAGLTGKCITSKCLKYWEVITKIRV
ncbi:MAG: hypothetical protein ACD_4C00397G0003 [uncultured bacterium (gcode 4)]|uniref:Uncharacterized protein n=1 Tax=uncultured bacterium (gcode 4) TaxID=1234023 RepID=K2G7Z8_9BACT|nr:MAG: hypothetical protein ACD_4C00397G0003 [uncultured bacterium (gcode 4)]